MIKAISTVIVGEKTFQPGQEVTDLPPADREWMRKKGYIEDTTDQRKQAAGKKGSAVKREDGAADELQGSVPG